MVKMVHGCKISIYGIGDVAFGVGLSECLTCYGRNPAYRNGPGVGEATAQYQME